ncbi:hypothetical protein BCR44DRAFT_1276808 [Catenaria anguillulae PL171]|uniref:Transmembrane protein n=1 Tax=Catenaria anguillulae PL171 TaxID=765915 RepID=A0A1Y2HC52_9FUNG|nr:hypothetical protein BCR44DRAFT_1276808 [Catenaria anguillulae PL171]
MGHAGRLFPLEFRSMVPGRSISNPAMGLAIRSRPYKERRPPHFSRSLRPFLPCPDSKDSRCLLLYPGSFPAAYLVLVYCCVLSVAVCLPSSSFLSLTPSLVY